MKSLDRAGLTALMQRTAGRPEITIGLIDGPVAIDHPDLADAAIQVLPAGLHTTCTLANSAACAHGTFVAGILCARRNSSAPAICPGCSLVVRPIFAELHGAGRLPSAEAVELAAAITECIEAGARVLNLSLALTPISFKGHSELQGALDHALRRGVVVVAAAGNQGSVGCSIITGHPWVIAVVACDLRGRPLSASNLGGSIGRRGLSAPGEHVTSLGADGTSYIADGTSVAAPFVTGAVALLWSEFPTMSAAKIKWAVTQGDLARRRTVVPLPLNAGRADRSLARMSAPVPRRQHQMERG